MVADDLQSSAEQQHESRQTELALNPAKTGRPLLTITEKKRLKVHLTGRTASLSFACALLLAPLHALALVGGELDRDERYAAVVKIIGGGGTRKHCSATKIGHRRFLTAAHCVLDMDSGRLYPTHQAGGLLLISNAASPKAMTDFNVLRVTATHIYPEFRAGLDELLANKAERIAGYKKQDKDTDLARGSWLKAKHTFTTRFPDVAVIVVDQLTPAIPAAKLDLESSLENAIVTLIGYGCRSFEARHRRSKLPTFGDRRWANTQVIRIDIINIYSLARRMRVDAPSLCPGDSGGPMMYKGKVVGVHGAIFGLDTSGGARSNLAVNLSELRWWQELSEPRPINAEKAMSLPGSSVNDHTYGASW